MSTESASAFPHHEPDPAPAGSIVVGHDGSKGAEDALSMALELAEELKLPVVVARAWSISTAPRPADWTFGYVPAWEEFTAAVQHELENKVRPFAEKHPTVVISYEPVHAPPVKSLITISAEARMLVLGTRGRGGLAGMLLGSVSEQCVRHALCPVLVVRSKP